MSDLTLDIAMMTPCRAALRSLSPGDASGSAHGGPASRGSSSTSPCLDQCGFGCKAVGHLKGVHKTVQLGKIS